MPKNIKFPSGLLVRCHEKGWMDEALVKDWLNSVWAKVGGLMKRKSLLVWDSFRGHLTQPVKNTLARLNTVPAIIPGGMTSMLQPLDVCVNKPFKDILQRKWQEWMLSGNHTFTAGGRKRRAELDVICNWIREAWEEIPEQLIKKSFLKYSITNSMDGTEDDILWQDDENATDDEHLPEDDSELLYADKNEVAAAEIDEASYMELFGESDVESEFEGF